MPTEPLAPGLTVSLAAPGDTRFIAQLSRDSIEVGLPWRYTEERIARLLHDRRVNVAVARKAGSLAGFGIMRYDDEAAHLHLLAVAFAWRRHGVATAILAWLETCARTAGIAVISLEARASNAAARTFYRQMGYRELRREVGYYLGREDAIRFAKDLRSDALA